MTSRSQAASCVSPRCHTRSRIKVTSTRGRRNCTRAKAKATPLASKRSINPCEETLSSSCFLRSRTSARRSLTRTPEISDTKTPQRKHLREPLRQEQQRRRHLHHHQPLQHTQQPQSSLRRPRPSRKWPFRTKPLSSRVAMHAPRKTFGIFSRMQPGFQCGRVHLPNSSHCPTTTSRCSMEMSRGKSLRSLRLMRSSRHGDHPLGSQRTTSVC